MIVFSTIWYEMRYDMNDIHNGIKYIKRFIIYIWHDIIYYLLLVNYFNVDENIKEWSCKSESDIVNRNTHWVHSN